MTRVVVDALGGDKAPGEVILGGLAAAADGIDVVLYGPPGLDAQGLPLVETTGRIEMAEKPAEAVREFEAAREIFKDRTDTDLLYACIEPSLASKEFFLQKAIGWALRQYAWIDPAEVRRAQPIAF